MQCSVPTRSTRSRSRVQVNRVYFDPPQARWAVTPEAGTVARVKIGVVKVLTEVANLRTNFRLAKLLESFKALARDPDRALELKRLHCYVAAGKVAKYRGPLADELAADFEALFAQVR